MHTTVAGLDVDVRGDGDPVLLVHGPGGGPHSWSRVAERLAGDGFEVRTFVRRGYGPGPAPATFADEVPDLAALLEAAGRPAHVVGASLGATLVLHAALADPRTMRSLVLFEPPVLLSGPHLLGVRERYVELVERDEHGAAASLLAREVLRRPGLDEAPDLAEARRAARGWACDLAQLAADSTSTARWSAISLPTLLLQGSASRSPLPEGMDALARALSHAERVSWAGRHHDADAATPDLFASTVIEFLRRKG